MKIIYKISDRITEHTTQEDFTPESAEYPCATIEKGDIIAGENFIISEADENGWFNIIVPELTRKSAKAALSIINNGAEIEIIELGDYISV